MMNIVLLGLRSAAKTSLGRLLASELNMGFVDTELLVELSVGEDIPSFVTKNGWDAFRILESSIIKSLVGMDGYVISTGGGCLDMMEDLNIIRSLGHIVWIKVPSPEILDAVNHPVRPPISFSDPKRELRLLLRKSSQLYPEIADIALDIGCLGPVEATKILKMAIQEHLRILSEPFCHQRGTAAFE